MTLPRSAMLAAIGSVAVLLVAVHLRLHPLGLVQVTVGAVLLIGCSTLALNASRLHPMSLRRALPGVLAVSVGNTLTPMGVGGSALSLRLHIRTGLSRDEALAAVTLRGLASAAAGLCVAGIAGSLLQVPRRSLPEHGHLVTAALAVLALAAVAVALASKPRRRMVRGHARAGGAALAGVLKQPVRAAVLLVAAVGVLVSQLMILDGAVRAVGGHLALGAVVVTWIGGSAVRAAVPTPGGVGPVEAALVAGLAAVGLPMATAAIAVGLYRTVGLWLPGLAGLVALRALRRRHLL